MASDGYARIRRSARIGTACSTNRWLRPVTRTRAGQLRPATRPPHQGSKHWPGPGFSFVLHPRSPPFISGHPGRVWAVHGRWRTPVNVGQHCWKACWRQLIRSSNLLSSVMLTCGNASRGGRQAGAPEQRLSHFLAQFLAQFRASIGGVPGIAAAVVPGHRSPEPA